MSKKISNFAPKLDAMKRKTILLGAVMLWAGAMFAQQDSIGIEVPEEEVVSSLVPEEAATDSIAAETGIYNDTAYIVYSSSHHRWKRSHLGHHDSLQEKAQKRRHKARKQEARERRHERMANAHKRAKARTASRHSSSHSHHSSHSGHSHGRR